MRPFRHDYYICLYIVAVSNITVLVIATFGQFGVSDPGNWFDSSAWVFLLQCTKIVKKNFEVMGTTRASPCLAQPRLASNTPLNNGYKINSWSHDYNIANDILLLSNQILMYSNQPTIAAKAWILLHAVLFSITGGEGFYRLLYNLSNHFY